MCGIIACVGAHETTETVLSALKNLDYRGYDSAGLAVKNGTSFSVHKQAGRISELETAVANDPPKGSVGIGHTRWSTHGEPSHSNAHPHTCRCGQGESEVAVVHNGIVENHQELRAELEAAGHEFTSETDTEVVPHLLSHYLRESDPEEAFRRAIDDLSGSYALVAMVESGDELYATRQDSPLVVGLDDDAHYLASDVPAFLEYTDDVVYLEDGDVVALAPGEMRVTDRDGNPTQRDVETVDWDPEETSKGVYDHFMHKEIESQPEALAKTVDGRIRFDEDGARVELDEFPPGSFEGVTDVQLVACGTSYHAALYGELFLNRADVHARAVQANEYVGEIPIDEETLVVAVTQSGETADTLEALRHAKRAGARTVAVTNVMGSTAAREAEAPLYIRSGPEIGVAATKSFSSQVVTLGLLSARLARDVERGKERPDAESFFRALRQLPDHIQTVTEGSRANAVAQRYLDRESYFFIGHRLGHPVALEGALKFKEITYEHAEGFASGELKHGPLALVTPDSVVISAFTDDHDQTRTNAREAKTRGATILGVGPESTTADAVDDWLRVPETHPDLVGLLVNVQLQLLSYHTAKLLDRPIDKPRNLAKSVTVK